MRKYLSMLIVVILVVLDQITKNIAVKYLKPLVSVEVIKKIFAFTFVENRGAAFGFLQGARWFFIVGTIVTIVFIVFYYRKLPDTKIYLWVRFSLLLICSGAIGNFIDRLINGYVVDFLHFKAIDFPVFNIADIYVVAGTILLSILIIFFIKDDNEIKKEDKKQSLISKDIAS